MLLRCRYLGTQAVGGSFPRLAPEPDAPLSEPDPAGTSEVALGRVLPPEQDVALSDSSATGQDAEAEAMAEAEAEAEAEADLESTSRLAEESFLQMGAAVEYVARQVSE